MLYYEHTRKMMKASVIGYDTVVYYLIYNNMCHRIVIHNDQETPYYPYEKLRTIPGLKRIQYFDVKEIPSIVMGRDIDNSMALYDENDDHDWYLIYATFERIEDWPELLTKKQMFQAKVIGHVNV